MYWSAVDVLDREECQLKGVKYILTDLSHPAPSRARMSKETLAREKFLSGNSSVERNSLARSKYLAADSPPDRFAAVSPPSAPTPPGLFSPVLLFLDIHTHPDRSLSTFPCSLAQLPTYSSIPAVTLSLDPCANEPMVNLVDTVISKGCPVVSSFPLVYIPATGVFVAIAISRSNTVTEKRPPAAAPSPSPTLCPRLFISGVLSHCGKTSICLSLLSHLLTIYQPRELAYIKPATQCEATSIITTWCAEKGIDCVPVGPVVFYKGFTRSYIDGSLGETAECMGDSISAAIDELSLGKKFILIDGVGYPAVGSITGTCNAAVAKASGVALKSGGRLAAPVVIIGKPGVGDAVSELVASGKREHARRRCYIWRDETSELANTVCPS